MCVVAIPIYREGGGGIGGTIVASSSEKKTIHNFFQFDFVLPYTQSLYGDLLSSKAN